VKKVFIILSALMFCFAGVSQAEEVVLKNGDKVTGAIVTETESEIVMDTLAMGKITIDKKFIQGAEAKGQTVDTTEEESSVEWTRKASIGYGMTGGNTKDSSLDAEIFANRKTDWNEATFKMSHHRSSSNKVEDDREYYGMLRYAYNLKEKSSWYQFYTMEWDQDRFSNIDYRLTPSVGVGYWFADSDEFKAMTEIALGYEYTSYRSGGDNSEVILVPRGFVEKAFASGIKFRQDLTMYPSVSDFGSYRLKSESTLINPVSDKVSIKVKLTDEYNSDPSGSAKKNDYRITSALEYIF